MSRRTWIASALLLGVYLFGWLALGTYESTRILGDGIAEIVVSTVVVVGLAALGRRYPVAVGILLIFPGAIPFGLVSATLLVSGVLGEIPHSLLVALGFGHAARALSAYSFLVALPVLAGLLSVAAGRMTIQRPL